MKSLNTLVKLLENDPDIKRFKELEIIIDQNTEIQQVYKELLHAQKYMVQQEHNKSERYLEAKQAYESIYARLLEFVGMQEYLDLLELINNDLQLIQSIIEDEINIDFD